MSLKNNRTIAILEKAEREGCTSIPRADQILTLVYLLFHHLDQTASSAKHGSFCRDIQGERAPRMMYHSYDANMVYGLIRACERLRSPGILQLFPLTLERGGGELLQFCLDAYVL